MSQRNQYALVRIDDPRHVAVNDLFKVILCLSGAES